MAVMGNPTWLAKNGFVHKAFCWTLVLSLCASQGYAQKQDSKDQSNRRAMAIYADAAGFQNNAAHDLAIEEWQKLLKEFPNDPLASKAWHYLGVCNIQLEKPNYPAAIDAFAQSLKDPKSEVREETLINQSWCLFTQARQSPPGSAEQKKGLERAQVNLTNFLSTYSDGGYVDQALFYLGEIEYSLGNVAKSIAYYKKMLDAQSLSKSGLRPDARYAIAVAYEEQKETSQATREYRTFLKEHVGHRLTGEVRVRLADILLADNKPDEAITLLSELAKQIKEPMADYAMLRLGYALALQGKNEEATKQYKSLLKNFPDSKHASIAGLAIGQSLHKAGKFDEALAQFETVVAKKDAQASEAAHWQAITLSQLNRAADAVTLLEDVLKWVPDADKAIVLKMDYADALYAMPDQLEKARAAYELIAREHPQDALASRATYNAAFAALQAGKFADARKWSEQFLGNYPQDPLRNDVAYVAAEALLQQGEHDAAAKAYAKLRAADPSNQALPLWTIRQATAHYLSGDYKSSIDVLRKDLAKIRDENQLAEAQFILGASLLYQEDTLAAIEQLTTSHQTSDRWNSADEVLLLLSEAHQRNKDNAAAKKALELLLKKYPATRLKPQVEYKLGQLSAAMNEFEQAITQYRAIVQNSEASNLHNFANYGIAWCLMQQEKYELALSTLQGLLRDGARDGIGNEARLAEGVCLRKLGKSAAAVDSLQQFLGSSPSGMSLANGLYELGLAYTEQRQLTQASQQFERLLNEVPDYPAMDKVLYELAWNYEDASQPEKATQYFDQLSRTFPDSEFAPEAIYMLAQQKYAASSFSEAATAYASVINKTTSPELLEKAYYKLGWSLFQQERFPQAAQQFAKQAADYPTGPLAVDALFMQAECSFKQDRFDEAFQHYVRARESMEANVNSTQASDQVKTLIYLHAAQCLREKKQWPECEKWLETVIREFPESPYLATALYELGFCKQSQNKPQDALAHYAEVAEKYRNEIAARSRFMMGEVYFSQRDFVKAIPEFQRVMYGFGGDKATEEIKNWQVKSAFEAARCSEVLIENLRGEGREKIIKTAGDYYKYIVEKHATHDLAAQAQTRLGELQKLR